MRRARKWIALLLLPLWPLAMLHCDLEAAGIDWALLVHHDKADDHATEHETSSVAHPSDDVSLQGAGTGVKVPCPELWLIAEQVPLVLCLSERQSTSPPPREEEPVWLQRTWRFDQRAALPARAPGHCA